MHSCISSCEQRTSWSACPRRMDISCRNIPSIHHARGRNVTICTLTVCTVAYAKDLTYTMTYRVLGWKKPEEDEGEEEKKEEYEEEDTRCKIPPKGTCCCWCCGCCFCSSCCCCCCCCCVVVATAAVVVVSMFNQLLDREEMLQLLSEHHFKLYDWCGTKLGNPLCVYIFWFLCAWKESFFQLIFSVEGIF